MKTELLQRSDGGFRFVFDCEVGDTAALHNLLQVAMPNGVLDVQRAKTWAAMYKQIHGHRFIAGNLRCAWMNSLLEEGLILEASTEEEYEQLMDAEGRQQDA